MAILKCKMCGGDIELSADKTFGTCEYCGSTMTFPKVDDEQRAAMFNRGNHFRRTGEFDKALAVYERIVQEDENDAEAHWCCALCRFGIEYVEDPNTLEYLPTCHRASFDSFLEDVDYLAALEHSDGITRRQYQKDAVKIAEVQRGILATSQNEEPFDVFICYKESEDDGSRTRDSLYAQDIYYQLTEQGRRVFFSRITLEDKAGTEYEPYIFAALNSAKVMILVTTSAEHANAVWVKNEWSRFLSLMRKDRSKLLLPCYRDMDPYDLPEALSVLQSYDMGKIGFIQDLIRGVNKVLDGDKPKETVKETVVIQQQAQSSTAPLLKRAFMFLEDGDFARADEFCEQVLNQDPENAEAHLGKLMAELKVRKRDGLRNVALPFDDRNNYQKAVRFGDDALKKKLAECNAYIRERNETARKEGIYQKASRALMQAQYDDAIEGFASVIAYKDAGKRKAEAEQRKEEAHKDEIYQKAMDSAKKETVVAQTLALHDFRSIPGWKDADMRATACEKKIQELRDKAEAERIEAERKAEADRITAECKAEEDRIAAEQRKRKATTIGIIVGAVAAVAAVVAVLTFTVFIPNANYKKAVDLYNAGQYEEAIGAFEALNGYKDSATQIEACQTAIKDREYDAAVALYNAGQYEKAIAAFEALNGYKDSAAQIEMCQTAIKDQKYDAAVELLQAEKYEAAIQAFREINGYKDSSSRIEICQAAIKEREYDAAVALYNVGRYEDAIAAFSALNGYKDSTAQIEVCQTAIKDRDYDNAVALYNAGEYENAVTAFTALNGYKDSTVKIREIMFKSAHVGSTVFLGSYEQDNDPSNGKEDIEWVVLVKEADKVLIISKDALDCRQYNSTLTNVTWETCSLREWLNETFLNEAFSSEEQSHILSATNIADKNPTYSTSSGNNTNDQVFILNIIEFGQYFPAVIEPECKPTEYAASQGAYKSYTLAKDGDYSISAYLGNTFWWLRTPGKAASSAMLVSATGMINYDGIDVNRENVAVRPALWIKLD